MDPLTMYAADVYTVAANLAGLPGISIPCGLAQGLPVGLQLMGPAGADHLLLKVARAYEKAVGGFAAAPEPFPAARPERGPREAGAEPRGA